MLFSLDLDQTWHMYFQILTWSHTEKQTSGGPKWGSVGIDAKCCLSFAGAFISVELNQSIKICTYPLCQNTSVVS